MRVAGFVRMRPCVRQGNDTYCIGVFYLSSEASPLNHVFLIVYIRLLKMRIY